MAIEERATIILTTKDSATAVVQKFVQSAHAGFFKLGAQVKTFGTRGVRSLQKFVQALRKVGRFAHRTVLRMKALVRSVFNLGNAIKAALVGGAIFVLLRGFDRLLELGGDVKRLAESFESLQAGVGNVADETLKLTRVATKGLISDLVIMRQANQAVLLGIGGTSKEFANLAKSALILGRAVSRGPAAALEDLTLGIGRQSRLILDNLGIIVKVGEANEAYANKLGISADALSATQQKTAFYEGTLKAIRIKVGQLGEAELDAADQLTIFKTTLSNTTDVMAEGVVKSGVLARVIELVTGWTGKWNVSASTVAKTLNKLIIKALPGLATFVKVVLGIKAGWEGLKVVIFSLGGVLNQTLALIAKIGGGLVANLVLLVGEALSLIPAMGDVAEGVKDAGFAIEQFGKDAEYVLKASARDNFESAAAAAMQFAATLETIDSVDPAINKIIADLKQFEDVVLEGASGANTLADRVEELKDSVKVDIFGDFVKGMEKARKTATQIAETIGILRLAVVNARGDLETAGDIQAIGMSGKDLQDAKANLADFARHSTGLLDALGKTLGFTSAAFLETYRIIREEGGANVVTPGLEKLNFEAVKARDTIGDLEKALSLSSRSVGELNVIGAQAAEVMEMFRNQGILTADEIRRLQEILDDTRVDATIEGLDGFSRASWDALQVTYDWINALEQMDLSLAEQGFAYENIVENLDLLEDALGRNSEEFQEILAILEATQEKMEEAFAPTFAEKFAENIGIMRDELGNFVVDFEEGFANLFAGFLDGFANMAASVIVEGRGLTEGLKNLAKTALKSLIAMLIKMGIQRLVLHFLKQTTEAAEASVGISSGVALSAVNAYAWGAAVGGPIGGAAAAAAAILGAVAAAGAGFGAGAAVAATGTATAAIPKGQEGGLITGETLIHAGELGRPELLLPLQSPRAQRAMEQVVGGGGGGPTVIEVGGISVSFPNVVALEGDDLPDAAKISLALVVEDAVEDGLVRASARSAAGRRRRR